MSSEKALISEEKSPLTRQTMAAELGRMGLGLSDTVIMHVSMGRLGWVCGGEQAVVAAVLDTIGPEGTLIMPGFSSQLSDPTHWSSPAVPKSWIPCIRDNMPVFDPDKTPTRNMGRVVETFRKWPGTQRSHHPVDSFLANGPLASDILDSHPLANSLGPDSPLGKIREHQAKVLLLGADYGSCTSFHLAESELPDPKTAPEFYPARRDHGRTVWDAALQPETYEARFPEIGAILDQMPDIVSTGFSGSARLFSMEIGVKMARTWLLENLPKTSA